MEKNALGRLTALFDESSFTELDALSCEDVITGYGLVDGAVVYGFAENSGGVSGAFADKIGRLYKNAVKNGSPVVGIYDSKGGDIKDGNRVLRAYGDIAAMSAELSGVVPQISVIAGLCAGASALVASMADFVIMSKKAELFITPPFLSGDSVQGVTGGSSESALLSGTASVISDDADDAVAKARALLKILPQNNLELSGNDYFEENDVPVTDCISVADKNSVIEIGKGYGGAFTALGSINWRTVGLVEVSDRISGADCVKIARLVSFCDAFSLPVLTLINSEGFELSSKNELNGSIRCAAKLSQTYSTATTPKISLVTGSAIGGAYIALAAFDDFTLAYENALISPITAKSAEVFMEGDYKSGGENLADRLVTPQTAREAILSALDVLSGKRVNSPSRKHVT